MSARQIQGRKQPDRKSQSERQGVRNNLPRTNLQNTVNQSQNRIRNIKSPFASDQTKTISNKPKPQKKRAVGQIPLRDRQHSKLKVNQQQSSGVRQNSGVQVRPLSQKKVQQQKKQIKKVQKKINKPNQFNRKNKTRDEIDKVFSFDSNERSFF